MSEIHRSRSNQRGAVLVLFTLMLLTVIIPLTGLAIDLTIMYVVQAKLWEAVDGAVLDAGRVLGTATTSVIQNVANQACQSNFPTGYWGSTNLTCTPTYDAPSVTNNYTPSISVTATATAPTLFMKVFQLPGALVSSVGRASRRPTRVVVVLDRSGSMAGDLGDVTGDAISFVQMFTPGYDEVGLVVFGNSGVVGYPVKNPGPYVMDPTDTAGGPDTSFYSKQGGCCDMVYAINTIASGGATNMSEGISLAYIELLKAHNRDYPGAQSANDPRNNVIVLFTDGVPNMISAYVNSPDAQGATMTTVGYPVKNEGVTAPGNALVPTATPYPTPPPANKTGCKYNWNSNQKNSTTNPNGIALADADSNPMIGVMGSGGAPSSFGNNFALLQMASLDTSYAGGSGTSAWSLHWLAFDEMTTDSHGSQYLEAIQTSSGGIPAAITNCNDLGAKNRTNPDLWNGGNPDLARIPPWDLYGNLTSDLGGASQGHSVSNASSFPKSVTYNYAVSAGSDSNWGQQLNIAAWNAVDQAGWRIRSDTTNRVIIYAIGYNHGSAGTTDDVLLARVANDPAQTSYNASSNECGNSGTSGCTNGQRQGQYFAATDTNQVADAFNKIAGMLLNLTR